MKLIKLLPFEGKTLKEVKDFLEKEYPNQLADIHRYNINTLPKDNNLYYFFGNMYSNLNRDNKNHKWECGEWRVPCIWWNKEWRQGAFSLKDVWSHDDRAVVNTRKYTKHICCDGECNHDDCCGKVKENCPLNKTI